jgi:predicted nucleic acid-binding protein
MSRATSASCGGAAFMIFDTDVLIWCFRGNRRALEMIGSDLERALSIVSFMELVQGARSLTEVREIRRFLRDNAFQILPLDEARSHLAASLMETHALRSGLQVADALIAATARDTGEILATGNSRHFRPIAGLRLKTFRPSGP